MGKVKDRMFTDCDDDLSFIDGAPANKINIKEDRNKKRDKLKKGYVSNSRVYIVSQKKYDLQLQKAEDDSENISSRRTDKYLELIKEYECLCYAKKLVKFPKNCISNLENLKYKFPHGSDLINSIIAHVHLQQHAIVPFAKLSPIVVIGSPGTGKSKITRSIAKILAPDYFSINLAIYPESFVLTGLTLAYDSGDAGEIAQILKSCFANNFVLIDELDKAVGIENQRRTPAIIPILELMEPDTARIFKDQALSLELDASFLTFIATANDIKKIPDPVLSRMSIFHLNQPTSEQIINNICNSIWADILSEETWGHAFSPQLSLPVREKLSKFSPRKIKIYLKQGAAFSSQRHKFHKQSKKKIILQESDLKIITEKRIRMGFV